MSGRRRDWVGTGLLLGAGLREALKGFLCRGVVGVVVQRGVVGRCCLVKVTAKLEAHAQIIPGLVFWNGRAEDSVRLQLAPVSDQGEAEVVAGAQPRGIGPQCVPKDVDSLCGAAITCLLYTSPSPRD